MAKEFVTNLVIGGKLNPSLNNAFKNASKMANKTSANIGKIGALAGKAVAGIGVAAVGIAGGFGLFKFGENAIEAGDNVYKLSQKLNLSTKEASQLNRILKLTDTEAKPFISTMQRMDKSIMLAGSKGNNTTKALAAFGLKMTDTHGKLLPMNDQLEVLVNGFQKAQKAGLDDEYAAAIFGARAQQMLPLLKDYSEAKEVAAKVKGIGIDPKAAHEASINLKLMKMQFGQLGLVAGNAVMPIIQKLLPKLTEGFAKFAEFISNHQKDIQEVAKKIGSFLEKAFSKARPAIDWLFNTGLPAAYDMFVKIKDVALRLGPVLEKGFSFFVNEILPKIFTATTDILPTLKGILIDIADIGQKLQPILETMGKVLMDTVLPALKDTLNTLHGITSTIDGIANLDVKKIGSGLEGAVKGYNSAFDKIGFVASPIGWLGRQAGKALGVSGYASGGIATRPSIFGEAGPEIAIPLQRTPRSRSLLNQANDMLGAQPRPSIVNNFTISVSAPSGNAQDIADTIIRVIEQYQIQKASLSFE